MRFGTKVAVISTLFACGAAIAASSCKTSSNDCDLTLTCEKYGSGGSTGAAQGPGGNGGMGGVTSSTHSVTSVTSSTSSITSMNSSTSSTSATTSVTSTTSTGTTNTCPQGEKPCNGVCVVENANHGCAGPSCAPCGQNGGNVMGGSCDAQGVCVLKCKQGYADCDGDPTNGCETPTDTDVFNCGACGRTCSSANVASLSCANGVCNSTCKLGFANCSLPGTGADDGCETSANTATNCGGCGNTCSNANLVQPEVCSPTPSVLGACGCTVETQCKFGADTTPNCSNGLCVCNGITCRPGETCRDPTLQLGTAGDLCMCNGTTSCTGATTCCSSGCHDLTSDAANCGACGHACPAGFLCLSGICACNMTDANCNDGAPAGSFTCPSIAGPDVCHCGATTCQIGQRCLPNGTCG